MFTNPVVSLCFILRYATDELKDCSLVLGIKYNVQLSFKIE